MKKQIILCLLTITLGARSEDFVISNLRDISNECDYLIITPQAFESCAQQLASHRNGFTGDDVVKARIARLSDIYSQFLNQGEPRHFPIWRSIKFAYEKWRIPPKYVVFMGDDSLITLPDGKPASRGNMPSFLMQSNIYYFSDIPDTEFNYADDFYTNTDQAEPSGMGAPRYNTNFATGRIPCENTLQCENYVSKVIQFDYAQNRTWRNNVVLIADDAMQRFRPDPLGYSHFYSAESIAKLTYLREHNVNKVYLSTYPGNEVREIPGAHAEIVDNIGKGALWTLYFGHGWPGGFADEHVVTANDAAGLNNQGMPTIVASFSCSNGTYAERYDASMCKQFLFQPEGGAVCYIASSSLEYSSPNQVLAQRFFAWLDSAPPAGLGTLLNASKKTSRQNDVYHYHLLGDPALRVTGEKLPLHIEQKNGPASGIIDITVVGPVFSGGNYQCVFAVDQRRTFLTDATMGFVEDSILAVREGIASQTFQVSVPENIRGDIKAKVFVWNSVQQGYADSVLTLTTDIAANNLLKNKPNTVRVFSTGKLVRFNIPSGTHPVSVRVTDISGRTVTQFTVGANQTNKEIIMDKRSLSNGNYIAVIQSQGKILSTSKFLIWY